MDCEVCCETMKKEVSCNLCGYKACYKCFSKFILECTINPKCMKCDKPWSRKSLVDGFGQYFVSHKYKEKRENILFDLEKALLPETQPHAIRLQKLRQLTKQEDEIGRKIHKLYNDIADIPRPTTNSNEDEIDAYNHARKSIKMMIHDLNEDIEGIHIKRTCFVMKKDRETRTQFVVKCPNETCRGYIGSNMKCEMCSIKLCKHCHVQLSGDQEHTCKEDDINTVKMLMTNTKNCPSCKAPIFKTDGCDQMFCTNCHTAFSWRTGEIVSGRIHNPHYYTYMRERGNQQREIGDIPCGGIPRLASLMKKYGTRVTHIHRLCTHIEFVEIPTYTTNIIENNRDLRISYLVGDITIEMFKQSLQKREKAINKKREISTILNTFLVVASDILNRSLSENLTEEQVLSEFSSIRQYTNNLMTDVSRVYTCVTPIITEFYDVIRERAQV